MKEIEVPNLPRGVRAFEVDGTVEVWQSYLGLIGQFFDREGKPTEAWLRKPLFRASIIGHGPEHFDWLARLLARSAQVDAERVSVRQTDHYAGEFLLDGKPLGLITPAAMHAYHEARMAAACAVHRVLFCEGCKSC